MIEKFKSLKFYNSYLLESRAEYFYEYGDNEKELIDILKWANTRKMDIHILGGGTNLLFSKPLIKGLVIYVNSLLLKIDGEKVIVGSGVDSALFSIYVAESGLSGAEFLYGLPGKLGGALYMNAKAFGESVADIISGAYVVDYAGNEIFLKKDDMEFAYKDSIFQHKKYIILKLIFKLHHGDKEVIYKRMRENIVSRREKGHYDYPSCGSFFKNPYDFGVPAGKMIEELGLKGMRKGDAEIFSKHANFILNKGNATAEDILFLMKHVQYEVKKAYNYNLEPEVRIW